MSILHTQERAQNQDFWHDTAFLVEKQAWGTDKKIVYINDKNILRATQQKTTTAVAK